MIKNERQKEILDILKRYNYASVEQLAKMTYSSPPTIRRDLNCLQEMGYLTRNHGGATLPYVKNSWFCKVGYTPLKHTSKNALLKGFLYKPISSKRSVSSFSYIIPLLVFLSICSYIKQKCSFYLYLKIFLFLYLLNNEIYLPNFVFISPKYNHFCVPLLLHVKKCLNQFETFHF